MLSKKQSKSKLNYYNKNSQKVIVEIVKFEGVKKCSFGHKTGDKFIFDNYGCNKKLCFFAQQALMPVIQVLLNKGKFDWLGEKDQLYWGCPHPGKMYKGLGQVIFKIRLQ